MDLSTMLRSTCAGRSNGWLAYMLLGLVVCVAGCTGTTLDPSSFDGTDGGSSDTPSSDGTDGGSSDTPSADGTDGGSSDSPGQGESVSFANDIQPILTFNCAGCHSPGGVADLDGIVLKLTADVSYDLLVDQPSVQDPSLTLVIPSEAESSLLYLKVRDDNPPIGLRMPRFAPPLSQSEQVLIRDWINQGAIEN